MASTKRVVDPSQPMASNWTPVLMSERTGAIGQVGFNLYLW